ncbi:MAG: hypothetical protein C5B58_00775 [Acidobacteria bacterium]|nr:MAG: hypothetical protein C5B58_00775 [Acidobacteriota bacterium]
MKPASPPQSTELATLQTVLDRLKVDPTLSDRKKRDLSSAITTLARLRGQPPSEIPLDLADIRRTLDAIVPAAAKMSRKRCYNLRSGAAAAIRVSGLRPMLKTKGVRLSRKWAAVLAAADDRVRRGISRFAHWASLHGIEPESVDDAAIDRFVAELEQASLVRKLRHVRGTVARAWNALVRLHPDAGLRLVSEPTKKIAPMQALWKELPPSLPNELDQYLIWAAVPDPLAQEARAKALSPLSLRLQRTHVRSAVSAAVAAGIAVAEITSLARLVEPNTFRTILGHLWRQDGRKLTAYTQGVAITLIAIASDWVKAPIETVATLKSLRSKLGALPPGLTEKNREMLLRLEDPRLRGAMLHLPNKLWHSARRRLVTSRSAFVELQDALAVDLELHFALRMKNLSALRFGVHLHWPQGPRKPALLTLGGDETKNDVPLEFEVPTALAERLHVYQNEIAPAVIGKRPEAVFVTFTGKPRTQAAISLAMKKTIRRHLGVTMSPHQFRHLLAQIQLDVNPGSYEQVRQMLGHKNLKTTTGFYAGVNTRRAGRAHAALLETLRKPKLGRGRHPRTP